MTIVSRRFGQSGLSLVEFMVASLIGLILILGLTQIFVSNRKTFDTTQASAYVQETGRIATQMLSQAIRNADYWGCVDLGSVHNNLNVAVDDVVLGFSDGVGGTDNNTDPADRIKDGTDTLVLRGTGGGLGIQIDKPMPNSSAILDVNNNAGLVKGQIIILTNCQGGDIFQITGLPSDDKIQHNTGSGDPGNGKNKGPCAGGGNGANCLSQHYDSGASVMLPYSRTFYVGDGASGGPALFMGDGAMSGTVGNVNDIELVEGVEDMQIVYGEDTDGDGNADVYRAADLVSSMGDVKSIRISLLVRSAEDNVLDSAQTVTFNGNSVGGNDRHLRRVYTFTSTLRNRI